MSKPQNGHLASESSELYQMMSKTKSSYSVDDRIHAVMLYITEANLKSVERITGIPYITLTNWKSADWWPLALKFCHKRKDQELELRFSKVINDAIGEIHDRVVNGDWLILKDGEKVRKPMNGRDLSVVMGVIHDKRQSLRGEADGISVEKASHTDKLKQLETKFQEFSNQLKAKTIDVEVIRE